MLTVVLFIFGVAVGSFLNAYIWRLKNGKSVWRGRSMCPHCKKKLNASELIPLFSFARQKGLCRHCHGKISWQYPLVELSLGLLFALVTYLRLGEYLPIDVRDLVVWLRDLFLVTVFLAIFVFDLRYYLIPDQFTLPALVIVFLTNWWLGQSAAELLVAVAIGFGFFGLQYLVSKGEWVGGGDLRLGALMGAALGWPGILVALFLAYVSGSLVGVFLLLKGKKKWKSQLPFGTFLSASAVVVLFWGDAILDWYLGLIGY